MFKNFIKLVIFLGLSSPLYALEEFDGDQCKKVVQCTPYQIIVDVEDKSSPLSAAINDLAAPQDIGEQESELYPLCELFPELNVAIDNKSVEDIEEILLKLSLATDQPKSLNSNNIFQLYQPRSSRYKPYSKKATFASEGNKYS